MGPFNNSDMFDTSLKRAPIHIHALQFLTIGDSPGIRRKDDHLEFFSQGITEILT